MSGTLIEFVCKYPCTTSLTVVHTQELKSPFLQYLKSNNDDITIVPIRTGDSKVDVALYILTLVYNDNYTKDIDDELDQLLYSMSSLQHAQLMSYKYVLQWFITSCNKSYAMSNYFLVLQLLKDEYEIIRLLRKFCKGAIERNESVLINELRRYKNGKYLTEMITKYGSKELLVRTLSTHDKVHDMTLIYALKVSKERLDTVIGIYEERKLLDNPWKTYMYLLKHRKRRSMINSDDLKELLEYIADRYSLDVPTLRQKEGDKWYFWRLDQLYPVDV